MDGSGDAERLPPPTCFRPLCHRLLRKQVLQLLHHVVHGLHKTSPVANKPVTAGVSSGESFPGDGVDLPVLLGSVARGDEGTTALRRLYHHNAQAQTADDAIAPRKGSAARSLPHGELRKHRPALQDLAVKPTVLLRKNDIGTATGNGGGVAAPFYSPLVCR